MTGIGIIQTLPEGHGHCDEGKRSLHSVSKEEWIVGMHRIVSTEEETTGSSRTLLEGKQN